MPNKVTKKKAYTVRNETAQAITEKIVAFGHENMQATHPTTLMITKDFELSKQGDCIIAVGADKALADLSPEFKATLRKPNAKLTIQIKAGDISTQIQAQGTQQLSLTHPTDAVIRKSSYICNRTLAVHADKAANDLPRALVEKLKNPQQQVEITLTVHF
ncbi:MAG: DUF371 domain-containing protein [Candidatus Bathyarchaeia archaeon]